MLTLALTQVLELLLNRIAIMRCLYQYQTVKAIMGSIH